MKIKTDWKNINNEKALQEFNSYLEDKTYVGGYHASSADLDAIKQLTNDYCTKKFPHVGRWHRLINSFTCCQKAKLCGDKKDQKEVKEKSDSKDKKQDSKQSNLSSSDEGLKDPFAEDAGIQDPFAENAQAPSSSVDEEDETEEERERQKKIDAIAAKKNEENKKKGKVKELARSQVIIDCKPYDEETDLDLLEKKVREIKMDGLTWLGCERVPIFKTLKKLRIICNIVDDLVPSTDDLIDKIQAFDDLCQSADLYAHNKL